jgi:hypothetical protein
LKYAHGQYPSAETSTLKLVKDGTRMREFGAADVLVEPWGSSSRTMVNAAWIGLPLMSRTVAVKMPAYGRMFQISTE